MFLRIFVEAIMFAVLCGSVALAAEPALNFLAFYSTNVESDHVKTAKGCDSQRRSAGRLDEHEILPDLHEHGAR